MKRISISIDTATYEKLKYLSQLERRFVSNQVRYCVLCYIRQYEEKNGEIQTEA